MKDNTPNAQNTVPKKDPLKALYFNSLCAVICLVSASPTMWPYIESHGFDHKFLALVMSLASCGEMVGSISFGYIHNKLSTKNSLLLCLALGLLGSVLYGYANVSSSFYLTFIAGKVLQGLWIGGQQSIVQAYLSEVADSKDKLKLQARIGIVALCGVITGPILGVGVSKMSIEYPMKISNYTLIGALQSFLVLLCLTNILIFFSERPQNILKPEENTNRVPVKPNIFGIISSCIIFFTFVFSFSVQDTVTAPIVTDKIQKFTTNFDWDSGMISVLLSGAGLMNVLNYGVIHSISGKVDERYIVLFSIMCVFTGFSMIIDYTPRYINKAVYVIAYNIICSGYAIGRNTTLAMTSKILGPHKAVIYT
jgi:MFS family permease